MNITTVNVCSKNQALIYKWDEEDKESSNGMFLPQAKWHKNSQKEW